MSDRLARRRFLGAAAITIPATLGSRYALGAPRSALAAPEPARVPEPNDPAKPGKTKNTRFAVNCEMWWSKLPYEDRLRAAAALGYPAVELWDYKNKNVDSIAKVAEEC